MSQSKHENDKRMQVGNRIRYRLHDTGGNWQENIGLKPSKVVRTFSCSLSNIR